MVIVGRYHYWTVGRVASAHSNVECSAVALLLGSTLAYGLKREVKNLALSAETHVPAPDMNTPRRPMRALSWSDTFALMPLVIAGL